MTMTTRVIDFIRRRLGQDEAPHGIAAGEGAQRSDCTQRGASRGADWTGNGAYSTSWCLLWFSKSLVEAMFARAEGSPKASAEDEVLLGVGYGDLAPALRRLSPEFR